MMIQNFHTPLSREDGLRLLRLMLYDCMPDQVSIVDDGCSLHIDWLDDDGDHVASSTNLVLMDADVYERYQDMLAYRPAAAPSPEPHDDDDEGNPIEFSTN